MLSWDRQSPDSGEILYSAHAKRSRFCDFFACLGLVLILKYEACQERKTQKKCSTRSHTYH